MNSTPRSSTSHPDPKERDYSGLYFETVEGILSFLRYEAEAMAPDEELRTHAEQRSPTQHKAYVLVTDRQLILLKTEPDDAPLIVPFRHPKNIQLAFEETDGGSLLRLRGKHAYEVSDLAPGDARRICDVVHVASFDGQPDASLPDAISFQGVYPIEYYEALLGPAQARRIDAVQIQGHRFELEVITNRRHAFFHVRHFVEEENEWREIDTGLAPFREAPTTLLRDDEKPYKVLVHAATRDPPKRLLARQGIVIDEKAETIVERYTRLQRVDPFQTFLDFLEVVGVQAGKRTDQYTIAQGRNHRLLHYRGQVFAFDSQGYTVRIRPVHAETKKPGPRSERGRRPPRGPPS